MGGLPYAAPGDCFINKIVPIEHAVVFGFLETLFRLEGFPEEPDLYYVRVPIGAETKETIVSFGLRNAFQFSCYQSSYFLKSSNIFGTISAMLFSYANPYETFPLLKGGEVSSFSEWIFKALCRQGVDRFILNELDGFFV